MGKLIDLSNFASSASEEKRDFFDNLALMISSGIDILVILDSLQKESPSTRLNKLIGKIKEDIQSGSPLWKSLGEHKVLPKHLITLIKIGEESGNLKENLRVVISQQQKDKEFKSKLRSASLYPMFVLVLMGIVGTVIALFVLPKLTEVYKSLRVDLPLITRIMIAIGEFLQKYGAIAIPAAFGVFAFFIFFLFIFPKTKFIGQAILFRIPLLKRVIQEIEIARMSYLLGTLLKKGLPITEALNLLRSSSSFYSYKKFYEFLYQSISKGDTFSQVFANFKGINRLIPVYPRQMIISSERSGNLDSTFLRINSIYEEKNNVTTKSLEVLFEPILLIIVWLGVGFVALAIILPIYSLTGSITDLSSGTTETATSEESTNDSTEDVTVETPTEETIDETTPEVSVPKIEILQSETGTLKVRDVIGGNVLTTVNTGETFEYLEEASGWYKIKLPDGTEGWINGIYAKKI